MKTLANLYDMRVNTDRALGLGQVVDWYNTQINDPNQYVNIELIDINLIKALQAINRAHVVVLMLDATEGITVQDTTLLGHILRQGRALVIVLKGVVWDTKNYPGFDLIHIHKVY